MSPLEVLGNNAKEPWVLRRAEGMKSASVPHYSTDSPLDRGGQNSQNAPECRKLAFVVTV
jgi:hypothetical protein